MMANLQFYDKLSANRGKIAIRFPSHTILINIHELPEFPRSHMTEANEIA